LGHKECHDLLHMASYGGPYSKEGLQVSRALDQGTRRSCNAFESGMRHICPLPYGNVCN